MKTLKNKPLADKLAVYGAAPLQLAGYAATIMLGR